MKMGVVRISHEYVVDLESPEMVEQGKASLYEDLMCAVKYGGLWDWLDVEESPDASPDDIPDFMRTRVCTQCKQTLYVDNFEDDDVICEGCKDEEVEEESKVS